MGKKSGIPCNECEHRFTDDTPAGRLKCPNCNTEYRLRRAPITGEVTLEIYTPISSVSATKKTPEIVIGKTSDAERERILALKSLLPEENECWFCRKSLTFMTTVRGYVKAGKIYVDKKSTDYVEYKDTSYEVFHSSEKVPLPESIAYKTRKVNSCPDCCNKLIKVIYLEGNKVTDKWAKTTGARRQHYSRSVDADKSYESRNDSGDSIPEPDKVISTSGIYFERIKRD